MNFSRHQESTYLQPTVSSHLGSRPPLIITPVLNMTRHSELEGVGEVPIRSEYTGQCGMNWTTIWHIIHWNPMRALKDMATLICNFWEPWKTNFIFLHFRLYWFRFWQLFDFQGCHLIFSDQIEVNYGNPESENALLLLRSN